MTGLNDISGKAMAAMATRGAGGEDALPRFMSVRQVARYLNVNEKKVYALVNEGKIPASKLTGKWLFPRDLLDQWLLESSHGGLLADRMVIAGGDDPLLARAILGYANQLQGGAVIAYSVTAPQQGLSLLARRRADVCVLNWGPAEESGRRHAALVRPYSQHRDWVMLRLFTREQGLMVAPAVFAGGPDLPLLFESGARWVSRQEGTGADRFLHELVSRHRLNPATRRVTCQALSERDAASLLAMGQADVATGPRAIATEFGLDFLPVGTEAVDLVMPQGVYFRKLLQGLIEQLRGAECRRQARLLGGYDLQALGTLVWSQ